MNKKEKFDLVSNFKPQGDQPQAISYLTKGIEEGIENQTLMGVTGSGKTFVMSNVIKNINKPTLVIAHNKTLAAQLASEFRKFFPHNAVAYFVSYYDYYQPEAYIPTKDLYIEKETQINEEIEQYRNKATQYLVTRNDVIIVASVSCIYGLGNPDDYENLAIRIDKGMYIKRSDLIMSLLNIQYERNDYEYKRGTFSIKGNIIEIFPQYEDSVIRIEIFDQIVEDIRIINPFLRTKGDKLENIYIFPAKHYTVRQEKLNSSITSIKEELKEQLDYFRKKDMIVEARRLEQRVNFDIEMIQEMGYCQGIENYSRHIEGRKKGSAPYTLMDFFPKDYLLIIDESHITLPQIRGMHRGDYQRKKTLVEYGFRLPSAIDNRPLNFEEFKSKINKAIYVSATPNDYEIELSKKDTKGLEDYPKNGIVEQIIRPTMLIDPEVEVRKSEGQIEDIKKELEKRVKNNERTIIITLTKKMSEELNKYLIENNFKTQYLHSDIDTIERTEVLRDLRLGVYDVIVGINLLREGLDLPEVSLIIILDADKEGFLRSKQSLIQIMGRAARHENGKVIMYADTITQSMEGAIGETERRRAIQLEYNKKNNLKPKGITKSIDIQIERKKKDDNLNKEDISDTKELIKNLTKQMNEYAQKMQFEKAAKIRDQIKELKLLS
jgi:excinuclease ABC subunit B